MAKIFEQWIDKYNTDTINCEIWNDLVQTKHLSFDLLPDHPVDISVPYTLPDDNLPHPVPDLLPDHPVDIPDGYTAGWWTKAPEKALQKKENSVSHSLVNHYVFKFSQQGERFEE